MKRWINWPQVVLAVAIALFVPVGWVSAKGMEGGRSSEWDSKERTTCAYLVASYALWTIYFDTAYGLQVSQSLVP